MAKTHATHNPQESVMTGPPGAGAAESSAAPAPGASPAVPTPENTPVPGGGRWCWDITKPGWVEVPDPSA